MVAGFCPLHVFNPIKWNETDAPSSSIIANTSEARVSILHDDPNTLDSVNYRRRIPLLGVGTTPLQGVMLGALPEMLVVPENNTNLGMAVASLAMCGRRGAIKLLK